MNRILTLFDWIGRLSIILFIWLSVMALFHFIILPVYTRQGKEVEVPELQGKLVDEARAIYKRQGFEVVVDDERFDIEVPKDVILEQFPLAGKYTKKGRRIHVAVSSGPPFALMPKLTGKNKEDALLTLQRLRIELDTLTYQFSSRVYENKVLSQSPLPDTTVFDADTVSIVVSLGPEPSSYSIPNLVGLPEDQALYLIKKAGFVLREKLYDRYIKHKKGHVVLQTPPPETAAAKNDSIDVIINGDPSLNPPEEPEEE